MMNDTTNNADPNDPNDLPVTMGEDGAMLPLKELGFLGDLMRILTRHVETLVDQRFAALVESHRTLALMDEGLRDAITEMIDDRVCAHEDSHEHKTDFDIESEVSEHFGYLVRQGQHDFVTERQLSEKISDVLDEVLEGRIRDTIDNATVSISI